MTAKHYDLVIVGGGISGASLLWTAARFTNLQHIALVEKYEALALVNSYGRNNSQTLHYGDIETNYTLDKALTVKRSADMLVRFAESLPERDRILYRYPKMVIGVGEDEVVRLRQRFEELGPHYPHMQLLEKADIAAIEPHVVNVDGRPRPEPLVACGSTDQYSAVDFAALANAFARQAGREPGKQVDVLLNTRVTSISESSSGFQVRTSGGALAAGSVVVSAGGHSLLYAKQMGYGRHLSCLPVAGSFYFAPKVLNGKVYTVQNPKLPFAAIHGDPDVLVPDKTRFGPTALILPMLERYRPATVPDYFRAAALDLNVLRVFGGLWADSDIRQYMIRNMLFEVPVLRRRLFLRDVRKIVPSMDLHSLQFAHHVGGIRPQLIDKQKRELLLGEAKITPGNGIIFNMTPSPGATSCLANAEKDARSVAGFLGAAFDDTRFHAELLS